MKLYALIAITVFAGVLTACESTLDRNYVAKMTYKATQDLLLDTSPVITQQTPMLVTTVTDVDNMETANTFGRVIAEQISSRLAQMGYNVTELKMRESLNIKQGLDNPMDSGEYILSRDIESLKGEHEAAAIVAGTYAVAGQQVIVSLKLLDVATGKIVNATDYFLPLDANTRRLLSAGGAGAVSFYGTSIAYE